MYKLHQIKLLHMILHKHKTIGDRFNKCLQNKLKIHSKPQGIY